VIRILLVEPMNLLRGALAATLSLEEDFAVVAELGCLGEALDRAREVLTLHKDKVQAVAARLLATEVIEEDAMVTILGPKVVAQRGLLHPEARQVISGHPVDVGTEQPPPTQHSNKPLDS